MQWHQRTLSTTAYTIGSNRNCQNKSKLERADVDNLDLFPKDLTLHMPPFITQGHRILKSVQTAKTKGCSGYTATTACLLQARPSSSDGGVLVAITRTCYVFIHAEEELMLCSENNLSILEPVLSFQSNIDRSDILLRGERRLEMFPWS